MEITPVAIARNGFTDKFGIPRQSRATSSIETRIVFVPKYRVREALRGIEGYSHLWLIWEFSEAALPSQEAPALDWQPTVRPPRLGGNCRMGVFATRSPFRPNRLGLSSVRLLRLEETKDEGLVLVVTGADLLDGTPIYDIKPYLSFSDSHPDARNGFAEATSDYRLQVTDPNHCLDGLDTDTRSAITEILSQDPRPGYQHTPDRIYRLDYAGYTVSFRVNGLILTIDAVSTT